MDRQKRYRPSRDFSANRILNLLAAPVAALYFNCSAGKGKACCYGRRDGKLMLTSRRGVLIPAPIEAPKAGLVRGGERLLVLAVGDWAVDLRIVAGIDLGRGAVLTHDVDERIG